MPAMINKGYPPINKAITDPHVITHGDERADGSQGNAEFPPQLETPETQIIRILHAVIHHLRKTPTFLFETPFRSFGNRRFSEEKNILRDTNKSPPSQERRGIACR
jgi:hypothetical protein